MATASARLEVNDEGAVETITVAGEKFENLAEKTDSASKSLSRYEEALQRAEEKQIPLQTALKETSSDLDDIEKRVGGLQAGADKLGISFEELASRVDLGASKDEFITDLNNVVDELESTSSSSNSTSESLSRFEEAVKEAEETQVPLQTALRQTSSDIDDIGKRIGGIEAGAEQLGISFKELASKLDLGAPKEEFINDLSKTVSELQNVSQESNKTTVSLDKLRRGFSATADEIQDTLEETGQLDNSVASASDRLNKLDEVAGETTVSFQDISQSLDFTVESVKEFNTQLNNLEKALIVVDESSDNLGDRLQELVQSSDLAEKSLQDLQAQAAKAEGNKEKLAQATLEAEGAEERYSETLSSVTRRNEAANEAIRERLQTLGRSEEQIAQTRVEQQQLNRVITGSQGKFRNLRGAGANVNEILFSTGDAIQDLQFGIRGAGNNIAFMAENFVQAASRGESFTSVLASLGKGLMGPIGIIVGLQTLLALGPQIVEFFSDAESEAKDFSKSIDEAIDTLIEFTGEFEDEPFGISSIDEANDSINRLLARLNASQRELRNTKDEIRNLVGLSNTRELTEQERERLRQLRNRRTELQNINEQREKAIEKIRNAKQDLNARKQVEEDLKNIGRDRVDQASKEFDIIKEIRKVQNEVIEQQASFDEDLDLYPTFEDSNLNEINAAFQDGIISNLDQASSAISRLQTLRSFANEKRVEEYNKLISKIEEYQKELKGTEEDSKSAFESIKEVQNAINNDEIDTPKKVGNAISFLEDKLSSTKFESEDARERIKKLIEQLKALRNEGKKSGNEIDSFSDGLENLKAQQAITQALTDNFVALGKAIGQGENVMKSFGKAALGVLQQVGTAMGKQLIAQGSALIASSLIPGQQGNAAAGAKLVAAGGALVAASSALGGIIGSGQSSARGSGGRRNKRRDVEGGGSVDIEGRRRGGKVGAGGLYETHGLGNREFFVPGVDGSIMTEGQLRSSSSRPKRTVEVVTENRLQGNINGPDLFELETRLSEVANFKTEFGEG